MLEILFAFSAKRLSSESVLKRPNKNNSVSLQLETLKDEFKFLRVRVCY